MSVDIIAWGIAAAAAESAAEANKRIDELGEGTRYKGAVNYYSDLPANPEVGDIYTVKYKGSSGSETLNAMYIWGEYEGTMQWIDSTSARRLYVHNIYMGDPLAYFSITSEEKDEYDIETLKDYMIEKGFTSAENIIYTIKGVVSVEGLNYLIYGIYVNPEDDSYYLTYSDDNITVSSIKADSITLDKDVVINIL